jgi:hypothetical protein
MKVSVEAARDLYGVVVSEGAVVDRPATGRLRAAIQGRRREGSRLLGGAE